MPDHQQLQTATFPSVISFFGPFDMVTIGKLRTAGIYQFALLCLLFGLSVSEKLIAQVPDGPPPTENERSPFDDGGRRGRGRRNFDPAQMIRGMDQDNNGVITSQEVERVPGFIRDRWTQQGLDFNRGVSVDELTQSAQRGMEEMRRNRDDREGRSRGDFERSDRREFDTQPNTEQGVPPSTSSTFGGPNSSPTPTGQSLTASGSTGANTPANRNGRARISPLIPDVYKAIDLDSDGQVALSEWKKSKQGPLSLFKQNDRNQDGYLTPKELALATLTPVPTTVPAPLVNQPAGSTASPPSTSAPTTVSSPSVTPAAVTITAETAAKAGRAFELLDKDKNGSVVGPEWDASSRLRPLFEKAGYNLTEPMSKDQFTQAYAQAGA